MYDTTAQSADLGAAQPENCPFFPSSKPHRVCFVSTRIELGKLGASRYDCCSGIPWLLEN